MREALERIDNRIDLIEQNVSDLSIMVEDMRPLM